MTEQICRTQERQVGEETDSRVILYVLTAATVGWSALIIGAVWYTLRWLI